MELIIVDTAIRQDAEGRFCLNDLHKAAGGEKKYGASYWLTNQQTKELVAELETTGIPVVTLEGRNGGTFVCKELVYAYAMWISPAFHLKVIRAYDAIMTKPQVDPIAVLNDPAAMRGLLLTYSEKVIELEAANAEMKPKVDALERIAEADDGTMCITNAAKSLQIRPKDMFSWLSQHRWIYKRAGSSAWLAYQDKIQQGVLEHKVTTVSRSDGTEKVVEQVLVTPKGLAKLAELIPNRPRLVA